MMLKKGALSAKLLKMLLAVPFILLASEASAIEGVTFSGYMTMKGTYTNAKSVSASEAVKYNDGLYTDEFAWDTHGNHIGLQANAEVNKKLKAVLEMQAHGGDEGYGINMQWAYGDYELNDNFTVRFGRMKGPFYMVSEYTEVGYAYPWVSPPQALYSTNPMTHMVGLDLLFNTSSRGVDYLLEVYSTGGKHKAVALPNFVDSSANTGGLKKGDTVNFETHNMIGFNALIDFGSVSFRAGYFDTKVDVPAFNLQNEGGKFMGLGMIVDWSSWLLYAEYIDRDTTPNLQAAFPDARAAYVTLGRRFGTYLPYLTYSMLTKGKDKSPYALMETSVALGLRYDIGDASALKLEAMQVRPQSESGDIGTYGLFYAPIQNNTATVFTISYDMVF